MIGPKYLRILTSHYATSNESILGRDVSVAITVVEANAARSAVRTVTVRTMWIATLSW